MDENEVLFMRSSKGHVRSSEGDSCSNEDDIWDDRILIEAYDKAVQLAQQGFVKKKPSECSTNAKIKKNEQQKWRVGDKCRCQYSEDLNYYEAEIVKIIGSTGMCIVRYVGYENEEKVSLKKLSPSLGNGARALQCQQAFSQSGAPEMDAESDTPNSEKGFGQKSSKKKKDSTFKARNGLTSGSFGSFNPLNFPFPQGINSIMPPPPPPHLFKNFSEDENETEAMSAMLISWYMSGYHTGYYHGLKMAKKTKNVSD